jgi:membrane protease YdiL (CAAX protease family)
VAKGVLVTEIDDTPSHEIRIADIWYITALTVVGFVLIASLGADSLGVSVMAIAELAILVPALVFLLRSGIPVRRALRLHPVSWRAAAVSAFLGISLSAVVGALDSFIGPIAPMPETLRLQLETILVPDDESDLIVIFVGLVLSAAVCEEIFFRGFLQTALERHKNRWGAIFISSLLFGIVHFNPWWFLSILCAGFVLGIVAYFSDSIYPGIIIHAINNGLSLLIANSERWQLSSWVVRIEEASLPAALVGAAILVIGIRWLSRQNQQRPLNMIHMTDIKIEKTA